MYGYPIISADVISWRFEDRICEIVDDFTRCFDGRIAGDVG